MKAINDMRSVRHYKRVPQYSCGYVQTIDAEGFANTYFARDFNGRNVKPNYPVPAIPIYIDYSECNVGLLWADVFGLDGEWDYDLTRVYSI